MAPAAGEDDQPCHWAAAGKLAAADTPAVAGTAAVAAGTVGAAAGIVAVAAGTVAVAAGILVVAEMAQHLQSQASALQIPVAAGLWSREICLATGLLLVP